MVDERAAWLRARGAIIESDPREYDYTPECYAVFFYDPDGIELETLHRPRERELAGRIAALQARLAELQRP